MSFRREVRDRGFTLIEIMVVLVVIAVLAGLVGPMVFGHVGDARLQGARTQIEMLSLALDSYRLDNNHYPSTAQGLDALVRAPSGEPVARRWRGPYLRKDVPLDPWGRPYQYRSPGDNDRDWDIVSLGRDGRAGGSGEDSDIQSWTTGP